MRGRAIEGAVRIVSVGHLGLRLVRHRPSHGLVSLPSTVRSQMVFRASGECGPASDPSGTPGLGPATIARIEWVGSAGANSRAMLDSISLCPQLAVSQLACDGPTVRAVPLAAQLDLLHRAIKLSRLPRINAIFNFHVHHHWQYRGMGLPTTGQLASKRPS